MLQVHVPVEPSQVPWPEQLSGQVLLAQLAPVNPVLQVHVPVEESQVPWPEQLSGQVLSVRQKS